MLYIEKTDGKALLSGQVLTGMFSARKSIFVDLLKWDVPVHEGRYEIDQFDTEQAIYLILCDEERRHLGSARLLPTLYPHILDSLYPELCTSLPPRSRSIFEITRFCLDRNLRAHERKKVREMGWSRR